MNCEEQPERDSSTPNADRVSRAFPEVRRRASKLLPRRYNSLQPTELAHEAWIRILRNDNWNDTQHIVNAATRIMKNYLIDRSRKEEVRARYRNGLPDPVVADQESIHALLGTLEELRESHPMHFRLVFLRFLFGMSVGEAADELGISRRQLQREWDFARSWLGTRLKSVEIDPPLQN